MNYQEPKLVLFSDFVDSGCGFAQAASGPFYCPLDRKVYIDLSFYDALKNRHQAPGDFAQAFVIAHEVGHHVQNLLGILPKVHELRQQLSKTEGNKLSVRLELQADCLAGLWAHHAERSRDLLEEGDIEEGLRGPPAPSVMTGSSDRPKGTWSLTLSRTAVLQSGSAGSRPDLISGLWIPAIRSTERTGDKSGRTPGSRRYRKLKRTSLLTGQAAPGHPRKHP